MRSCKLICVALTCVAAACASTAADMQPTAAGDARFMPAKEIGCPYAEPSNPPRAEHKVTLELRVLPDGSVDPGAVRPILGHHDTRDRAHVDRAINIARGCTFHPALADGAPVASTVMKRFYFNVIAVDR